MATNPDYTPASDPQPIAPPTEMPPMPGDIDQPVPMGDPEPEMPAENY